MCIYCPTFVDVKVIDSICLRSTESNQYPIILLPGVEAIVDRFEDNAKPQKRDRPGMRAYLLRNADDIVEVLPKKVIGFVKSQIVNVVFNEKNTPSFSFNTMSKMTKVQTSDLHSLAELATRHRE